MVIETYKLNQLKEEAKEQHVSLDELCRQKMKSMSQLDRIEKVVEYDNV